MNRSLEPVKSIRRAALPALATGLAVLLSGCGPADDAAPKASPLTVVTRVLEPSDGYDAKRMYTGTVEATRDSAVGFEIAGKIARIAVDEGSVVESGTVVARLDTLRLQAKRAELAASLEQVGADLALARATLARTEDALSYKGVSAQQFDEASQQVNALSAAYATAEARVASIDVDLDKAVLRAPFDSAVVARLADEGEVLGAGAPLLRLQSTDPPEVRLGLSSDAAGTVTAGRRYDFTIEGRQIGATLKTVVPRRDDLTRTVDAIFVLDARAAPARPGDLARLTLTTHFPEPGFWVPMSSLAKGVRGLWTNYVAQQADSGETAGGETYRIVPRTVELLYSNSDRAYVRGTLTAGDRLIVDGLHRIVPGQLVALAENPSADHESVAAAGPED